MYLVYEKNYLSYGDVVDEIDMRLWINRGNAIADMQERKKIYIESKVTIFILILATTIFSSLLNILASIAVHSSFITTKLIVIGIVVLPVLNSIMALILYKVFDKSILKLKED